MTKLLVCPVNYKHLIGLINSDVEGFIIGINNFSMFFDLELNVNEIKEVLSLTNKEVFVVINKPLYNTDLNTIKKTLIDLSKTNITGILFDDISIININNELKLNLNLVWSQMHLVTNYHTCNYWYKKGINHGLLSTEISLNDIFEIKDNTDMKLMVYLYGYLPMFESSRELITNYFKYINKNKEENYSLYEPVRNKHYKIYEKNNETFILEDIINGIKEVKEIKENNIDYIIINGLMHEKEEFDIVINCYINALKNNADIEELANKLNNNNTGFLYKKTVYKVKI